MKTKWWVGLAAVVLAAGCVPSIHPWFADKDVIFEEKLLGVWEQEKEDNLWIFEKEGEGKAYRLTIVSKDKDTEPAVLDAHLFKINGKMFLDTYPGSKSLENSNDFFKAHIVGAHQIFRINSIQPMFEYQLLNPDTVGKMLKEKPELIAHESPDNSEGVLLTAPTEKLQKFIAENADKEEFFGEGNELKRRSPLFTEKDFTFESKLVGRWIDDVGTVDFCDAVNNQSYRITSVRSTTEKTEVMRYSCAAVTVANRRFLAVYEGRGVAVTGGSDADRTPDLLVWIEQVEPNPQFRVIEYGQAAEILKMNDEQFKAAVEKLQKVRWTKLAEETKQK